MKRNIVILGVFSLLTVVVLNLLSVVSFSENVFLVMVFSFLEIAIIGAVSWVVIKKYIDKQNENILFLEELSQGNVDLEEDFSSELTKKYEEIIKRIPKKSEKDEIAKSIKSNKEFLLKKSEELFSIVNSFEEKVSEQNNVYRKVIGNFEKTTGEVQEITSAANVAAQTSLKTLELTSSTVELATSGVENVEKSLIKMGEIKENTDITAESVIKLEEKANEIGGIIGSITKISEQTNLLALNAAIEAARAGEAGKGFAVVAQEIRGLADESRKAAENINNIVTVIQSQTKQAVAKMNKASEVVTEGSESSSSVGESLTIMLDSISKINNMMQDVAAGAQQQSANTHEIANQMDLNAGFINQELGNIEKLMNLIKEGMTIINEMKTQLNVTDAVLEKLSSENKNEKRLRVRD
ncbi:MAG: hypothetical protein GX287_05465 [Fusobacteria bacterium]|nr:hypothetical protein [Fusobacteriota bacterium]